MVWLVYGWEGGEGEGSVKIEEGYICLTSHEDHTGHDFGFDEFKMFPV